jgi:putative ATP-dependent endonuclease of OLD family
MNIRKVTIKNFKCFKDFFELDLSDGVNIIVGNNEEGKSTILEAIHLALSGLYNGRYLRNELSEYLFNIESINEFKANPKAPPEILIEIFFSGDGLATYEGDNNSERKKNAGLIVKVEYVKNHEGELNLPIEYFEITWTTFAREVITTRNLPIKPAFIDSTSAKMQNGSDLYISHIIKTHLEIEDKNKLTQAHRKLQGRFMDEPSVKDINDKIKELNKENDLKLSVDLSPKNAWENNLLSFIKDIPFHFIGKGQQAIIKTKLALEHNRAKEANIILIEEPENHLSHTRLNQLIKSISDKCITEENKKQVLITTHNSFVANKLGLNNLILLNNKSKLKFTELSSDTINYFQKISGYDTLRLILCEAAILCEGPSDELIIQKKYLKLYEKLPIEDGIEVISVGLSFSRYMEIAVALNKKVAVVTDNDNKVEALEEKYESYINGKHKFLSVFFDRDSKYPTLEPQMIKVNGWEHVNKIIDEKYKINGQGYKKGDYKLKDEEGLLNFMSVNKTECALKFFDTKEDFKFPKYIEDAIQHLKER